MKHNKLNKFFILLVLQLSFLSSKFYAQESKELYYNIKQISQAEGFAQGTVNAIIKDKAGFMWFGTQVGLVKYDGYNYTLYTSNEKDSNSISDSFIQSLFEDNDGIIWIGGSIKGLSSINPYTGKITKYNFNVHLKNEGQDKIYSVTQDKNGIIWVGTSAGGIFYSDKEKKNFKKLDININVTNIVSIKCDKNNNIWASTDEIGLVEITYNNKPENATFKIHHLTKDEKQNKFPIHDSYLDLEGNLWLVHGLGSILKKDFNQRL